MDLLFTDERYGFVSAADKGFIVAFNEAMERAGYENNGVQPYVVFGKYKIEYTRAGLKTKKYVARIYLRDDGIALRLYLTNIDRHGEYIEKSPEFIRDPFVNERGRCKHCDQNGGGIGGKGRCSFKKTYTLDGVVHEKCAGENFFFGDRDARSVPKYVELLTTFYPGKKRA